MSTKQYRWLIVVATLALTVTGTWAYVGALSNGGVNALEWFSTLLFIVLFGWIAFSFAVATVGFLRQIWCGSSTEDSRSGSARDLGSLSATAVLIPVYNESPDDVFARIEAMMRGLAARDAVTTESEPAFDFFVLSDSTDTETWLAEELAWSALEDRLGDEVKRCCRVFYRHRSENQGRKAGNIADFCERWSRPYPFMIVLDADSLMSPDTMIEIVQRMSADDRLGILQVPPVPIGRLSLFARLQQFAAQAYGPVFVEGFAAWSGDQGNYWGHNAIIRVAAFCDCCDLPILPGQAPLGGEILSHDFVEASLMVRSHWKVRLATDLRGSYEECPTTLTDYAIRDQRWCQGNLQHSRLVFSNGFHPVSRMHFASGVMAYFASPLWVLFTLVCVAGWAWDRSATTSQSWVQIHGRFALFAAAMLMLLIPKAYGLASHLIRGRGSSFGGALALAASGLIETMVSVVLSPIMALLHSRFVVSTLRGHKVRWAAQQRGEHGVTLFAAARDYGVITLFGVVASVAVYLAARPLLIWFAPILAGLVFAVPLAMMLGGQTPGLLLRRARLLLVPEEVEAPEVAERYELAHRHATHRQPFREADDSDGLLGALLRSPTFFMTHQLVLSASEADTPLNAEDRAEVLSRVAAGDLHRLPSQLRRHLLSDAELLREIHIQTRAAIPSGNYANA